MSVNATAQLIADSIEQQQALLSLQEASAAFNDPDPSSRARGEAVFLQFRQSQGAVEHCLYALERSQDAYVHFQCLSVLLQHLPSLTLQSPTPSVSHLRTLRDYFLALISTHTPSDGSPSLWPTYTRTRAYQAFAAVQIRLLGIELEHVKHTGQAEKCIGEHTAYVHTHVIANNDFARSHVNLALVGAVLDELATGPKLAKENGHAGKAESQKSRAIDHSGLSALQHRWVRAWMQEQILQPFMGIIVGGLSHSLSNGQNAAGAASSLLALSQIAERVLRWSPLLNDPWAGLQQGISLYDLTRLLEEDEYNADDSGVDDIDTSETSASSLTAVRSRLIPASLSSAFLDVNLISLVASAYASSTHQAKMGHSAASLALTTLQSCILALCAFAPTSTVPDGSDQNSRRTKLLETAKAFLMDVDARAPHESSLADKCNELLFVAQVYYTTLKSSAASDSTSPAPGSARYDAGTLLNDLAGLTSKAFTFAFSERRESDGLDDDIDELTDETVHTVLAVWLAVSEGGPEQALVRDHLFDAAVRPFIEGRLHYANTTARDESFDADDEEYGEENTSDQEKYDEVLITLATLARRGNLSASLNHVRSVSDGVVRQFADFYGQKAAIQLNFKEMEALEGQWETLHWLLLIAGHILADASKGELASVASEIKGLPESGQGDVASLLQSLGANLLQIFTTSSPDKPQSPQVIQTVLWFNARYIPAYLLVDSTPLLSSTFNGQHGLQYLSHILSCVENVIGSWLSDSDVILQVAGLLRSFAVSEGVMQGLLSNADFERLVTRLIQGFDVLPAKTHKTLISALVGCIYASHSSQSPEVFFARVTQAIEQRLSSIVHRPDFAAVAQDGQVLEQLLNALDMFDGLAASLQPKSSRAVFGFLSRFFETLIGLTQMYKERPEVATAIIRVFRTLIGALDLGFGVEQDIVYTLNEAVWRLLDGLEMSTVLGDSPSQTLEDEVPFEGLCLILDMLDDLLLASDGDSGDSVGTWLSPISQVQTSDVCLFGFSRLVPLLQGDVLSVANVRVRLAHLSSQLFVLFGHRMAGMVLQEQQSLGQHGQCAQLFRACVNALALSLGFDETKAMLDSLEAIDTLARGVSRVVREVARMTNAISPQALQSGSEIVLDALLSPLLEATLRALLIDPLAPSLLEYHIHTLRQIVDTVVTASVAADGRQKLQGHLQAFCESTSLHSARGTFGSTTKHAIQAREDGPARRISFMQTVAQLVELCLSSLSSEADRATLMTNAREVAWAGRAKLQVF